MAVIFSHKRSPETIWIWLGAELILIHPCLPSCLEWLSIDRIFHLGGYFTGGICRQGKCVFSVSTYSSIQFRFSLSLFFPTYTHILPLLSLLSPSSRFLCFHFPRPFPLPLRIYRFRSKNLLLNIANVGRRITLGWIRNERYSRENFSQKCTQTLNCSTYR